MKTIGERIKARRELLKLSQDELAKKLGYKSRSSINKIETDSRNLTQSKIKAIADALGTTPSYIMGWEEEPEPDKKQNMTSGEFMSNKNIFAKNLKYQMAIHQKSRKDICEALGFSYYTFSDWVNGKKYPRMDKVEMLANYFGILKSDLIEEKPEERHTMTIGNLFEYLRKQQHLSVSEFAEEIGLSEQEIRAYETGAGGIPTEIVKMLADYFDIPFGKLTAGKVKGDNIFAAFASTNEAYVQQVTKWVEVFGDERFSDEEFEKIITYAKFILSLRQQSST